MPKRHYEKDYKTWEAEQRQKKDELAKQIHDIADNWQRNPEDMADYLAFASRFYNYSTNNSILIYKQNPDASFCGSFQKFQELGYSVKKGEKAIKIFVPTPATYYRENADADWKRMADATAAEKAKIKSGEYESRQIRRFKVGNVFDISQTTCPIEDYPKIFRDFGYSSDLHGKLFDAIAAYSQDVLHCPVNIEQIKELTLRGFYRPYDNSITISDRLQDTQKLSVLTHELGHAILHNADQRSTNMKTNAQMELEADAVSIMLQNYVGVEIPDTRKAHLSDVFHTFAKQQSEFGTKPDVTLENILDNVTQIYKTEIETIQHYIDRSLEAPTEESVLKDEATTDSLKLPYVHVIWSEDPSLPDNSYYSIKDAQNIFAALDAAQVDQPGYNKTKFQIHFADGTHYDGRQDFGDGDGGIIDHIQKFWNDECSLRTDLDPQELESRRLEAEQLVKTLWDAYDDNYITSYGQALEKYKEQGDLKKVVDVQDEILAHLGNKRNRTLEFEETGTSHKIPILSVDNATESGTPIEDDAGIEA